MLRASLIAATASLALAAGATAQERVEVGLLNCEVEGGGGFIIGSTKDLVCTYEPADEARPTETYHGEINKFGLDVGVTGETIISWAIFAPTGDPLPPGALEGDYVGASAEATAGVGVGANALVSADSDSFMLQPVSVQAQGGLNLAVGVTEMELRAARN